MPYVPSKKTDGKSKDREILDPAIDRLAEQAAERITDNSQLIPVYEDVFFTVGRRLSELACGKDSESMRSLSSQLAEIIFRVSKKYGYDGAYLGELNYAITRFIQRVPQIKYVPSKKTDGKSKDREILDPAIDRLAEQAVERGEWNSELRYWIYARTVEALLSVSRQFMSGGLGIGGVFHDIKDEYKRRVNTAYENAQIRKSGDCYDTPYYTRAVPVKDKNNELIGYVEIMLERTDETLNKDVLDYELVLRATPVITPQ